MTMKRLTYLLMTLMLAMGFASCADNGITETDGSDDESEGQPVVIDGSALYSSTGASTRAMSATAVINSLYALVFNEEDLLIEVIEAKPGTYNDAKTTFAEATADGEMAFYVILHASSKHRVVHLVANYVPSDYSQVEEYSVMKGFTTSGTNEAYWCRIDLAAGITTDDKGIVSDATKASFQGLSLVRNFAEIKVQNNATNFTIEGYYVFNQPDAGTVAPWNSSIEASSKDPTKNLFATFTAGMTYSNVLSQEFYGYEPEGLTLKANPDYQADGSTDGSFPFITDLSTATYVYEKDARNDADNRPFVIIKGLYSGSTTPTYYKADLCYYSDAESKTVAYYNLIRNLRYTVQINQVTTAGYATIDAAVSNPAMNNFMSSTQSVDFPNVSANNSQLFVSTTDELITEKGTLTLKFRNVYDAAKDLVSNSINGVDAAAEHYVTLNITPEPEDGTATDDHLFYGSITYGDTDTDGYRSITLKLKDLPADGSLVSQDIVIYNDQGLQRTIKVSYREPYKFDVIPVKGAYTTSSAVLDTLPQKSGASFNLALKLPAGLSANRFPMTFHIESALVNFYPDVAADGFVAMSVATGWSLLPDNPYESYHYERIITWNEYSGKENENGYRYFDCFFKTYRDIDATDFHMSQYRNRYRIVVQTDRYFESPLFVLKDCARTYDNSLFASD